MRCIRGLAFSLGLGVLMTCGWAQAQDAPQPAVQVIIGSDGSVKVIDPKTGKEIASVVTKVQANPEAPKAEDLQRQQAQKQLERARHEVERVLQAQQRAQPNPAPQPDAKKIKIEFKDIELQIQPGPDGKPRIITLERQREPAKPATLDQKVDLILKQLDELRRDVNQLKSKLDGKQPNAFWQVVPNPKDAGNKPAGRIEVIPLNPGPDKKAQTDEAIRKAVEHLRKQLEQKAAGELKNQERPVDGNADLERRLERILREAEELRREIRKTKPTTK